MQMKSQNQSCLQSNLQMLEVRTSFVSYFINSDGPVDSLDAKKWFDAFEEAKKVVRDGKVEGDDSGDEDDESEEEEEEEEKEEGEKKEKDQKETDSLAKQLEEVKV
jgi:Ran GTPase-activating protein (RanGAP) involved in mRNA processing and transport